MADHTTDKLLLAGVTIVVGLFAVYTGRPQIEAAFLLSLGAFVKALASRVDDSPVTADVTLPAAQKAS